MKTTIDLPEHLLQQLRLRANQQHQPLDLALADLLQQALASVLPPNEALVPPIIKDRPFPNLPFIECPHAAGSRDELTPDRVAEILLQQEVAWFNEAR